MIFLNKYRKHQILEILKSYGENYKNQIEGEIPNLEFLQGGNAARISLDLGINKILVDGLLFELNEKKIITSFKHHKDLYILTPKGERILLQKEFYVKYFESFLSVLRFFK